MPTYSLRTRTVHSQVHSQPSQSQVDSPEVRMYNHEEDTVRVQKLD